MSKNLIVDMEKNWFASTILGVSDLRRLIGAEQLSTLIQKRPKLFFSYNILSLISLCNQGKHPVSVDSGPGPGIKGGY